MPALKSLCLSSPASQKAPFVHTVFAGAAACVLASSASAAELNVQPPVRSGWHETPLWANTLPRTSETVTQSQFMDALSNEVSLLSRLREWRNTFRGTGSTPRRNFRLTSLQNNDINFILGAQQLPAFEVAQFGSQTGAGLSWNRVAVGSTYAQPYLNRLFQPFDEVMSGQSTSVANTPRLTWLTARPLETDLAKVDLLMARRETEIGEGSENGISMRRNDVWGARAETGLDPLLLTGWKLRTEWMNSESSTRDDEAAALKINLDGPIRHPWGEARAGLNYNDADAGFTSLSGSETTIDRRDGTLWLQQGMAKGPFSGNVRLALSGTEEKPQDSVQQLTRAESSADLQWKLSQSLALGLNVGRTQSEKELFAADTLASEDLAPANVPADVTVEDRAAVRLQRRTSSGGWGVHFARREFDNEQSTSEAQANIRLEAERQLLSRLRLKGAVEWARNELDLENDDFERSGYSAEAQLNLSSLGRLDVRYRENEASQALAAAREYGARLNFGSAAQGNGLGLAVEYARRMEAVNTPTAQWRVGLTYR